MIDYVTIAIISLILLIIVSTVVLKMNVVVAAGVGSISGLFGAAVSYGVCYFIDPVTAVTCALAGSISSMWSSALAMYFTATHAKVIHLGIIVGG